MMQLPLLSKLSIDQKRDREYPDGWCSSHKKCDEYKDVERKTYQIVVPYLIPVLGAANFVGKDDTSDWSRQVVWDARTGYPDSEFNADKRYAQVISGTQSTVKMNVTARELRRNRHRSPISILESATALSDRPLQTIVDLIVQNNMGTPEAIRNPMHASLKESIFRYFEHELASKSSWIRQSWPELNDGYDIAVNIREAAVIRHPYNGASKIAKLHSDYDSRSAFVVYGVGIMHNLMFMTELKAKSPPIDWSNYPTDSSSIMPSVGIRDIVNWRQYYALWQHMLTYFDVVLLNYWTVLNQTNDSNVLDTTLAFGDMATFYEDQQVKSIIPTNQDFEILTTYRPPEAGRTNDFLVQPDLRCGDTIAFPTLQSAHAAVNTSTMFDSTIRRVQRFSIDQRILVLKKKDRPFNDEASVRFRDSTIRALMLQSL